MDRIQNGFDLSEITECRDISKAFYSIKKQNLNLYNQLINRFFYDTQNTIYNRFVLCRNLVLAFSKLYPPISNKGLEMDLKILNFDIKPSNILVHLVPIAGKFAIVPFILDIDNLTLENKSKKLSPVSTQITTEYRAPEGPLDEYYDYFSIAVILYQLIFDTHPFTVRGGTRFSDGDTRDYYIKNRCFAWGKNRKFLTSETKNDWRHNNFNFISPQLQTLFIRAFDSEIRANRPAPSEWSAELKAFIMVNNGKLNTLFKSA
jgi:serine/threonine protein kinase